MQKSGLQVKKLNWKCERRVRYARRFFIRSKYYVGQQVCRGEKSNFLLFLLRIGLFLQYTVNKVKWERSMKIRNYERSGI